MRLISHRGNFEGKDPYNENHPYYIKRAIDHGFDVEIDVRFDNGWWLGHEKNQHKVDLEFLSNPRFWIHCKNIKALVYLQNTKFNYFWHDADSYTLTSHGWIWAYPNNLTVAGSQSIAVLPEIHNTDINLFSGICSDVINNYIKEKR
tara:strand:+ start:99 stop:539 length:441 start_codon:yes stop_codon:yes gene_type:complete